MASCSLHLSNSLRISGAFSIKAPMSLLLYILQPPGYLTCRIYLQSLRGRRSACNLAGQPIPIDPLLSYMGNLTVPFLYIVLSRVRSHKLSGSYRQARLQGQTALSQIFTEIYHIDIMHFWLSFLVLSFSGDTLPPGALPYCPHCTKEVRVPLWVTSARSLS